MNKLFQQIRESESRAKARRLQALERFHVGDVAYPIGLQGALPLWGIVVDVNPAIHKVVLNLNGVVRQFEPEELLLTNPELKAPNRAVEDKERVQEAVAETVGEAFKAFRKNRIARVVAAQEATRLAALRLRAGGDYEYRPDPDHKHKPQGGGWEPTDNGWSRNKREKGQGEGGGKEKAPESPEVKQLRELAASPDGGIRVRVARNLKTPPDVLEKLAGDRETEVRSWVAGNWNTSPQTLEKLAEDPVGVVRARVAANKKAPVAALAKVATDENWMHRATVAHNPNCPPKLLAKLATDEDFFVRSETGRSLRTPAEALAKLAADENDGVSWEAARNLFTPSKALAKMENHNCVENANRAMITLSAREEALAFKKSLGNPKRRGRSLQELQRDFIANMDPSKYKDRASFEIAKERVKDLSPVDFGRLLKAVAAEDEEEA